jgi:prolyl oligopeptidase
MSTTPELATDPYLFLEDAGNPATIAWTAEQNARTRRALDALPGREAMAARFDALLETDAIGVPTERGGRFFATARRGRMNQAALFVRSSARAAEEVLIDPAALDPSGLTALDWWYPSPSGRYVAFGLSTNGDERSTLAVLDVVTRERLSEAIPDTRYCSLAWYPDESGFYYTRFPQGEDYDARVYRHTLGSPWQSDVKIFGDGRPREDMLELALSADGRRLTVRAAKGWARSDLYLADTAAWTGDAFPFVALAEGIDASFDGLPTDRAIYVRTNDGAPRFRLFAVDPAAPERSAWREIVPEGRGTLDGVAATRSCLVLHLLEDVRSVVRLRRSDGSLETVPGFGDASVMGLSAHERSDGVYVLRASFLNAPSVLHVDTAAAPVVASVWESVSPPFDGNAYRVSQEWFASKDGTRVPMWVVAKSGTPRDGTAPAVLYGYGGFSISLVPGFTPSVAPWLDAGGVYAIANLRGGGEFGDDWHRAGMRERKQNVFDDFIAAVEFLGSSRIADPDRIAVYGGSNGGLLVAALATQRPELVRAIVCAVPLTDMLRYHLFSIGRLWIAEYGDPDDPADAAFLRAYSPYHNVRDGVAYPAMFVETAESDGRVDPLHAKKFGARVQAATSGPGPILVHVEPNAGHGAGKPRDKIVAELTDRWSFLAWTLGQRLT